MFFTEKRRQFWITLDRCRVTFGKCSFKPDMLSCKMSNKTIEYATRNVMDISCTSGRQKKKPFCFKTSFQNGVLMHFKTNFKNCLCIGFIISICLTWIRCLFFSLVISLCSWIYSLKLLWQNYNWSLNRDSSFTHNGSCLKKCTSRTWKFWSWLWELYPKLHREFMKTETQGHCFFRWSLL